MSADLEQRKETLEVFEDHFRQILASGYYLEDGYSEIVDTVINGVLSQHTAHSCLPGLVEKNPWLAPELDPLMRTPKGDSGHLHRCARKSGLQDDSNPDCGQRTQFGEWFKEEA